MKNKIKLSYYAIFDYDENGIDVIFPDHPACFSCGLNVEEAKRMAIEALELELHGTLIENIPLSSNVFSIRLNQHQTIEKIDIELEIREGKLFCPSVIEF